MQSSFHTCMDLAAVWRWTFLSKWFYAARRPVRAPHVQPRARPALPTDPLTYDFSSTCGYSGDAGWMTGLNGTRLTFWAESERKKTNKKKKHHNLEHTPECSSDEMHSFIWPFKGIKTLHEEIRNKEADSERSTVLQLENWSNTTGKVTGHFHLDLLINPLCLLQLLTQPALLCNKRTEKLHSALTTPQRLFTATGWEQRFGLFITLMWKTDRSLQCAWAEVW